jgi:hypothetical protein
VAAADVAADAVHPTRPANRPGASVVDDMASLPCVMTQTCLYVAGSPLASKWSGLPVLAIVLAYILDSVLGVAVGKVRRDGAAVHQLSSAWGTAHTDTRGGL